MQIKLLNENFNRCQINKEMATLNEDDNGNGRTSSKNNSNNHNNNNNNSNNNNNNSTCSSKRDIDATSSNNNDDTKSTKSNNTEDPAEIKLKKQALEQRKQDLEKLLNEKSWLLQQIQKTETQILNGNCEYINASDIFSTLALQYKQEQAQQLQQRNKNDDSSIAASGGDEGSSSDSAILRRKNINRENILNNNITNNRNSEVSNRSSEYDNYPTLGTEVNYPNGNSSNVRNVGANIGSSVSLSTIGAQQQMPIKSALKKRSTPTPTPGNANFLQLHRQQHLLQQLYQQQQQQQHHQRHFQHQQQQNQQSQATQFDAISLYSVNSANVATLRQQQVAPQQQPIIVQCDKYYLSPTHQNYNDGGFIRSSQNIKQYISPLNSPKHYEIQYHLSSPHQPVQQQQQQQQQQQNKLSPLHHHIQQQEVSPLHSQRQYLYHQIHTSSQQQQPSHVRHLDAISLAPSYISVDSTENSHQTRWRSQSHLPTSQLQQHSHNSQLLHHQHSFHHTSVTSPITIATERDNAKSHSSDMLATSPYYTPVYAPPPPVPSASTKPKPLDEISISSVNSDTQKKTKSKQWVESSLDGPVIRSSTTIDTVTTSSNHLPPSNQIQNKTSLRDRTKLSSQSMSAAPRHYSISSGSREHNTKLLPNDCLSAGNSKLLQDDEGRYAKLSQSTSYLNKMEATNAISAPYSLDTSLEISSFKYLPPKPSISSSTAVPGASSASVSTNSSIAAPLVQRNITNTPQPPPPRPPPLSEKPPPPPPPPVTSSALNSPTAVNSPLSPDIRIESPKNMTIVQQATFQPYKEVTKPFEMSDFYKYSTKFRQKENTNTGNSNVNNNNNLGGNSLSNHNLD